MMFFCDIISILHKSDPSCTAILDLLLLGIMVCTYVVCIHIGTYLGLDHVYCRIELITFLRLLRFYAIWISTLNMMTHYCLRTLIKLSRFLLLCLILVKLDFP